MKLKCANCDRIVFRQNYQLLRSKSGRAFCSKSCSTSYNNRFKSGKSHPNWNDGISLYRTKAIKAYGALCAACNYNNENVLIVHHIDENRKNNAIENLIVLCPTHHVEIHLGIINIIKGKVFNGDLPNLTKIGCKSNVRSLTFNSKKNCSNPVSQIYI